VSWKSEDHYTIVTGTDGGEDQCRGLAILVRQLAARWEHPGQYRPIEILCPESVSRHVKSVLSRERDLVRVRPLGSMVPPEDPYALKFLLSDESWLNELETSRFLYLDCDHLAFTPIPTLPSNGGVWIGSENTELTIAGEGSGSSSLVRALDGRHPNTSLIAMPCETMRACRPEWWRCYQRLEGIVSMRWREELAFCWAVVTIGLKLNRVPPTVQSCWSDPVDAALFHYGGESRAAKMAKGRILTAETGSELEKLSLECSKFSAREAAILLALANGVRELL